MLYGGFVLLTVQQTKFLRSLVPARAPAAMPNKDLACRAQLLMRAAQHGLQVPLTSPQQCMKAFLLLSTVDSRGNFGIGLTAVLALGAGAAAVAHAEDAQQAQLPVPAAAAAARGPALGLRAPALSRRLGCGSVRARGARCAARAA